MRVLVLTSGGIDSTTCLAMSVEKYGKENVVAMSVSYGQKHTKELKASTEVANYYGVEHIYVNLADIFKYSDCSLLEHSDKEIPHDTYANQLAETDGAPVSTYVPFRNGLFLNFNYTPTLELVYGIHPEQVCHIHGDCRDQSSEIYFGKI